MSLYVLIERGARVVSPLFTGPVMEFFQPAFLLPGSASPAPHLALFLSPVDAALCKKYMNTRPRQGEDNRYEMALHDAPDVMNAMNYVMSQGARLCLILGFSTDTAGRLVIRDGCYSLSSWTLTQADLVCLQGLGTKSAHHVLEKAYAVLAEHGADGYEEDIQRLDLEGPPAIHKMAELALAQIGAVKNVQDGGFSIFSPSQARWRKLV